MRKAARNRVWSAAGTDVAEPRSEEEITEARAAGLALLSPWNVAALVHSVATTACGNAALARWWRPLFPALEELQALAFPAPPEDVPVPLLWEPDEWPGAALLAERDDRTGTAFRAIDPGDRAVVSRSIHEALERLWETVPEVAHAFDTLVATLLVVAEPRVRSVTNNAAIGAAALRVPADADPDSIADGLMAVTVAQAIFLEEMVRGVRAMPSRKRPRPLSPDGLLESAYVTVAQLAFAERRGATEAARQRLDELGALLQSLREEHHCLSTRGQGLLDAVHPVARPYAHAGERSSR